MTCSTAARPVASSAPPRLHAILINLDEWGKITAALDACEEGGLMRALRAAWSAEYRGQPPATLPDDDERLCRLLGGDTTLLTVVRAFFVPRPDGFLAWDWLTEQYDIAQGKYAAAAAGAQARWSRQEGAPGVSAAKTSRSSRSSRPRRVQNPVTFPQQSCDAHASHEQPDPDSSIRTELAPTSSLAAASRAAPARDPIPVARGQPEITALELDTWAQRHPEEMAEINARVDARMDALNPSWRERGEGGAIRLWHLRGELYDRVRRSPAQPLAVALAQCAPSGGSAHA